MNLNELSNEMPWWAEVVLLKSKKSDGQNYWFIKKCPVCGQEHKHGANKNGLDEPWETLGNRVPHCIKMQVPNFYKLLWNGEIVNN